MKSISEFPQFKSSDSKLSMVTCYDYWSAKILAKTDIDILLVGDSVSMVVHGFNSTIHATPEMMATHTAAVARAGSGKFILSDLPFLVHRSGKKTLMKAVDQIMKAGAQALKIETAPGQEKIVRWLTDSGVPVVGHVGLTPQHVHQFGGYKVQGRRDSEHQAIVDHSFKLEEAGCHALVLECVPSSLAKTLTEELKIPTVGIGAGKDVNGQVLVLHDLLGFNKEFKARFVRNFAQGEDWLHEAVQSYAMSIKDRSFPSTEESFQ